MLLIAAAVSKILCESASAKSAVPEALEVNLAPAGIFKPNSIAFFLIAVWASSIRSIYPAIVAAYEVLMMLVSS
jgi:hypothetical protein